MFQLPDLFLAACWPPGGLPVYAGDGFIRFGCIANPQQNRIPRRRSFFADMVNGRIAGSRYQDFFVTPGRLGDSFHQGCGFTRARRSMHDCELFIFQDSGNGCLLAWIQPVIGKSGRRAGLGSEGKPHRPGGCAAFQIDEKRAGWFPDRSVPFHDLRRPRIWSQFDSTPSSSIQWGNRVQTGGTPRCGRRG